MVAWYALIKAIIESIATPTTNVTRSENGHFAQNILSMWPTKEKEAGQPVNRLRRRNWYINYLEGSKRLKRRNRSKNSFESSVRLRSNRSTNSLERSEKLELGNWFLFNEYASLDFTRIFRDHSLPIPGEEFWSGFHEENSLTIQPLITHWRSCHVLQIYHQHLYFFASS